MNSKMHINCRSMFWKNRGHSKFQNCFSAFIDKGVIVAQASSGSDHTGTYLSMVRNSIRHMGEKTEMFEHLNSSFNTDYSDLFIKIVHINILGNVELPRKPESCFPFTMLD